MDNVIDDVKIATLLSSSDSGQLTITPAEGVDCSGFQGAVFYAVIGAMDTGAEIWFWAEGSSDNGVEDAWAEIAGSGVAVDTASEDKMVVVDVYQPVKRYVRFMVSRDVADSQVTCILVAMHGASRRPVPRDAAVTQTARVPYPIEGEA